MKPIVALHALVTPLPVDLEPTDAELDAIEWEMPLILAGLDLLDAEIAVLNRTPSELDAQRIRRARRRALAAHRALTNQALAALPGGAA
ncbi:DUF6284 family protein [Streptomyces sp. NPDC017949]|uniref:DUF6284 family protein n=1 Tax=Streptomyces sp. NPDC017949 TaxID=3365020 RepID=UPI0037B6FF37